MSRYRAKTTTAKRRRNKKGTCEPFLEWHRDWSGRLYAMDFDLVEYEFVNGEPRSVAYFEYKHVKAPPLDSDDASTTILAADAKAAGRPAFLARYDNDRAFRVLPLNGNAERYVDYYGASFSERTFVQFLWSLRTDNDPVTEEHLDALELRTTHRSDWPNDNPPFR